MQAAISAEAAGWAIERLSRGYVETGEGVIGTRKTPSSHFAYERVLVTYSVLRTSIFLICVIPNPVASEAVR
jgi:hypothetical protein